MEKINPKNVLENIDEQNVKEKNNLIQYKLGDEETLIKIKEIEAQTNRNIDRKHR